VLASVPARRGRLGGTATTTTGDSRRGTGNGGNGSLARLPGKLFFVGEAAGACCRCCRGWLLLLCAGELSGSAGNGNPVEHHSQATGGSHPAHRPRRTARPGAETSPGRLAAPEEVGEPAVDTKHPETRPGTVAGARVLVAGTSHHHGCQGRRRATRREHRQPQLHQHTESG
jgi:hypothetical protein